MNYKKKLHFFRNPIFKLFYLIKICFFRIMFQVVLVFTFKILKNKKPNHKIKG